MVFGYIRSSVSIPEGIHVPVETMLDVNYRPYVKVLEDDASETITVCYEKGKRTFPFEDEGPMLNRRNNAIRAVVDAVANDSEENKIVFRGLTTLGTINDVKELYLYMLERKVDVEFFATPLANTKRYSVIMEKVPYQAVLFALDELEFSYKRESFLNENGWCESTPSLIGSQMSRKGKKRS